MDERYLPDTGEEQELRRRILQWPHALCRAGSLMTTRIASSFLRVNLSAMRASFSLRPGSLTSLAALSNSALLISKKWVGSATTCDTLRGNASLAAGADPLACFLAFVEVVASADHSHMYGCLIFCRILTASPLHSPPGG